MTTSNGVYPAPPATRKPPYPVATMLRARELHAAGWYPTAIRRILTDEGYGSPAVVTIQLWTNERYHRNHQERMRERGAERTAEAERFRLPGSSEPYRVRFMLTLRREGLSYRDIAKVCSIMFATRISDDQVRYRLRDGDPPEDDLAPARRCRCGTVIPYSGRGRPRTVCDDCRA